jgi:signal transduction histidine kinase
LRTALMVPALTGIATALASVFITSQLMFLSTHDMVLLSFLLLFALAVSAPLAHLAAAGLSARVAALDAAASKMGEGDLEVRVDEGGADELASLAHTFNTMANDLDQLRKQRLEIEQARKDLVAAISHDLRTPVASLRAMIEAIKDGVVDEVAARGYLDAAMVETQRLGCLIDDLFEMSRIDAGQLPLHLVETDVAGLISDTVNTMQPQAAQKNIHLAGSTSQGTGAVLADGTKLQRGLYNIVHNALRHTPSDGSVMIEASQTGAEVVISVSDTGSGIAGPDLPHIFDRFYRGDPSRHDEGAGLGLAIARGIVEAHRGRIWAESETGAGARFCVALPRLPQGTTGRASA